jgi:hypothetical protein
MSEIDPDFVTGLVQELRECRGFIKDETNHVPTVQRLDVVIAHAEGVCIAAGIPAEF